MAQIFGQNIGSPFAIVDSDGRLHVSVDPIYIQSGNNLVGSFYNYGNQNAIYSQDKSTNAQIGIDYNHHEIHNGTHFYVAGFSVVNSGGCACFETTTPNGSKWMHMVFNINSNYVTEFNVFEGATLSGGTATTPINHNRNCPTSSELSVKYQPVISGGTPTSGTKIYASRWGLATGTGATSRTAGGEDRNENEIILKSGTTYLWEIKSLTDANLIDYVGNWYEHTDKTKQF